MTRDVSQKAIWDRWQAGDGFTSLVRPARDQFVVKLDAKPEPVEINLATSALIVIDMQNDFLHQDGWFSVVRGSDVSPLSIPVEPINSVASILRRHGAPAIHVNWGVRSDAANLPANTVDKASACGRRTGYADQMPNGPVLVADSWGSQSVDEIEVDDRDYQVFKHRLSGFRDNELDQLLRRLGVTTLFYTGVNLDRCVFATLMDGCFQGYDAILIEDACATASPEPMTQSVLTLIRMLYGFTVTSGEVIAAAEKLQPSNTSPTT